MFEKALKGNNYYWMWLAFLGFFIAVAAVCYLRQFFHGLGLTGMTRDVSWGCISPSLPFWSVWPLEG
jgi:molybdopterin-containing oxidoreductase family membrane subunit